MPRPTVLRSARALVSAAVAATLLVASPATAAVAVQASVEDLARTSDVVVRGSIARRSARRVGPRIYTEVTLRAAAVWRGSAPAEVTVRVPGGEVGNLGQRVDGAPVFAEGEEVVLFLSGDRRGAFQVNGLAQGKFRVDGASASPDLSGVHFVRSEVRVGERAAESMPLQELERRVREAR